MENISSQLKTSSHPSVITSCSTNSKTFSWDHLPLEMQASIIRFSDTRTQAKLARTSKSNCELIFSSVTQELNALSHIREYPDLETYLNNLRSYANLKSLNLSNVFIAGEKINDKQLNSIIKVVCEDKNFVIEELNLKNLHLTLEGVSLPGTLRELYLDYNKAVTNAGLISALANTTCLQRLDLNNTTVSLEDVSLPATLRQLYLGNNTNVTNAGLISALAGNKNLQTLHLDWIMASLEGVSLPSTLRNLRLWFNEWLTNAGLISALAGNTSLETLNLGWTKVSLEGVSLPGTLRELCLYQNIEVTNTGLISALAGNTSIESLSCGFTRISASLIEKILSQGHRIRR